MSPRVGIPVLLTLRALLVIAAVSCLCVSSNVGLQFFPLPAAEIQVVMDVQQDQARKASHAPHADAQSFRVPMMVQSQKRADQEAPQSDPFIALPIDRIGLPRDTRVYVEIDYPVCFLPSVTMVPAAGRAPPSLV